MAVKPTFILKDTAMRNLLTAVAIALVSASSWAGSVPGDVNFGLDASPNNHAYKFRLVVNGGAVVERQAWSYEKPGLAMRPVGHWLGFWDEVAIEG